MIAFCGYNIGDYFKHWLAMGKTVKHPPHIFQVNWFRKDAKGKFVWPGFGENMRVLRWVVERCQGQAHARETVIGWVPDFDDMSWQGLDFGAEKYAAVTDIDSGDWVKELALHDELFAKIKDRLPKQLALSRELLGMRLGG